MAQLLGIRIRRYRALHDVALGRWEHSAEADELPPLMCLIGPNGSGKSTVMDAFGFLADCLLDGTEAACDKPHRGGFKRLRTQGETGPIALDLYFRPESDARAISYSVEIDERDGVPVVAREVLKQARVGAKRGRLYPFVDIAWGQGTAWSGESTSTTEGTSKVPVDLAEPGRLAITTLGQLKEHPRIVQLRAFIEGWYLSYFLPDAARVLPPAGAQKHLNRTGDNLGNVVQYMQRSEPKKFQIVLDKIQKRIPGLKSIKPSKSPDGRLLLQFDEQGYADPFYQQSISDGTLKMFAYLLLLEDPEPRPFIGIEEPENGLYHKLLERLASELKGHAAEVGTTVLVTTHSPYFVDALSPEQVWLIEKNEKGGANLTRAADMPSIKDLVDEGVPLGSLWYSNHLESRVQR
jgi:predicted ATPase